MFYKYIFILICIFAIIITYIYMTNNRFNEIMNDLPEISIINQKKLDDYNWT